MWTWTQRRLTSLRLVALATIAVLAAGQAQAQTNLVTNGGFETLTTPGVSTEIGGTGSNGNIAANVVGWNSAGYSFVFTPNPGQVSGTTADTTGAYNPATGNQLYLWGPGTGALVDGTPGSTLPSVGFDHGGTLLGVANGLSNSPAGGNFVALDGSAGLSGALSQTVSGLQGGGVYKLTFYWAAAEQSAAAFDSATTEQLSVSLGNTTQTTQVISAPAESFSGWFQQTIYFEAGAGTSQTLSFLALGTPNGAPPFALLDGVSLVLAPEPSSWALIAAALAVMLLMVRVRRIQP